MTARMACRKVIGDSQDNLSEGIMVTARMACRKAYGYMEYIWIWIWIQGRLFTGECQDFGFSAMFQL